MRLQNILNINMNRKYINIKNNYNIFNKPYT